MSTTRSETAPPAPAIPALDAVADPVGVLRRAYEAGHLVSLPTSGTTGPARRVVRTARSWVDSFAPTAELCGLGPRSRVWVPGPTQATMNLYALLLASWAGAERADLPTAASHAFVTPAGLAGLLDDGAAAARAVVAGDRLDSALADRAERAGWRVDHYYGAAQLSFVAWGRDAASLLPYPEVDVEARDGELWVRSPWVCVAETGPDPALRRDGAWTSVGDLGRLEPGGRVVVTGRPGLIVTAGASVSVAAVEDALHPLATGPVYVVGSPHPRLGQVVVAVCTDEADLAVLPAAAREVLGRAERPRRWLLDPAPPLSAAGKIDRAALAARVAAG